VSEPEKESESVITICVFSAFFLTLLISSAILQIFCVTSNNFFLSRCKSSVCLIKSSKSNLYLGILCTGRIK
jgi:hypothetical protein